MFPKGNVYEIASLAGGKINIGISTSHTLFLSNFENENTSFRSSIDIFLRNNMYFGGNCAKSVNSVAFFN